jgi:hypothetical protein
VLRTVNQTREDMEVERSEDVPWWKARVCSGTARSGLREGRSEEEEAAAAGE